MWWARSLATGIVLMWSRDQLYRHSVPVDVSMSRAVPPGRRATG